MNVYYYQYEGKTYLIAARGPYPGRLSPIWKCNTSIWLIPGTFVESDDDGDS